VPDAQTARTQLQVIQERIDTRKALQEGTSSSNEAQLTEALAKAKSLGMAESEPAVAAAKAEGIIEISQMFGE